MTKKHDENCDCCNHDGEDYKDCCDEFDTVYLTLDDDSEIECNILGIFEVEDKEYIALLPYDDDQVFLYEYVEDEDGIDLINIEDDEEFDVVSEAFYTLFVEEDFDVSDLDYDDCDEFEDDEEY